MGALTLAICVGVASAASPIVGDDGDNVITGTDHADRIKALGGNDTVAALRGHGHRINGGSGNDVHRRRSRPRPASTAVPVTTR